MSDPGGPTDPSDPFRNPSWTDPAGGAAYPPTPPTGPGATAPPGGWIGVPTPPAGPGFPGVPGGPGGGPAPAPRRPRWPLAVAVVAGIGVAALAIGVLSSDDEDDPSASRDRDEEVADDDRDRDRDEDRDDGRDEPDDDDDDQTTTSEAAPPDLTDLPDPGGPVVTSGALAIQLPEGWRGADLSGGVDGAGAAMFPDDPQLAAAVQGQLELLPRAVLIMGFDAASFTSSTFASNVSVIVDPTAPAGMDMEQMLVLQQRGLQGVADVEDARVVSLGRSEVGRIRSRFTGGPASYDVLSYIIDTGDQVVVLTFSFGDLDEAAVRVADASAATFTAG